MPAVWMRVRAELRGRWRAGVLLAIVLGVVAGGALAAAAGARRTESAYPRFLDRYRAFDVTVSTGGREDTPAIFRRIARLPMVSSASSSELLNAELVLASGQRVAFPDVFLAAGTDTATTAGAMRVLEGRASDPARVDEVMVAYGLAERLGLEPGDRIDVVLGTGRAGEEIRSVVVTGTFAAVSNFETVTGTGFPTVMMLTPAFVRAHPQAVIPNEGQLSVLLEHGEADLDAFTEALDERGIPYDSLTPASLFTPGVQRLNRIPQVALWTLAGSIALAALALVGQSLAREARGDGGADASTLAALGMSRAQLSSVAALRMAVIAVAGMALSVPVAIALSPLTPIGLARIAEPDPGFYADWTVLALGPVALLVALFVALTPVIAGLSAGRRPRSGTGSALAGGIARSGAPVSSFAGVSMAFEPGRGARAVPSRSAMFGAALAVGALVAALGFDRSFARLQEDPGLSGYVWDAAVIAFDPSGLGDLVERVEAVPGVEDAFRGTVFGSVAVDDETVSAVAYEGYAGSIVRGRAPAADDELMLDGRTMRELGLTVGDTVTASPASFDDDAGAPGAPMEVVGRFVPPRLPFQASENPEQAAFLTLNGLRRADADAEYDAVYARFVARAGEDTVSRLRDAVAGVSFAVLSRGSAATVRNVARLAYLPLVLAGILGALGAAALVHALGSAIRRRRRDLAVLKTLGFVGGQVRSAVAWQSTALAAVGLLVGVPIGIAVGRWGWLLFADQLDVVPQPVTSMLSVVLVVAGALVLANLIAALPARAAARTQPAVVLRAE